MYVSIQTATELTKKSRSTISRHIKSGKLSRTSEGIEISELIRVYGELKQPNEASSDESITNREQWLMNQIEDLQQQLKELKNESLEREKRLMALLEHKGGLFGRLFNM